MEKFNVKFYKNDAKAIVDGFFDNKLFRDDITRDDMAAVEEYLAFSIQSRVESWLRSAELMARIEKSKIKADETGN